METIPKKVAKFCIFFCIFLHYHEKVINALYELAYELAAICLPHHDGGIPPSAFPLSACFPHLLFDAERQAGKL